VGWRVASLSFFSMCRRVFQGHNLSTPGFARVKGAHRLSGIVKPKEEDFGILVH